MADLTIAEQRALIEMFAPVLLFHPDEKFYPVDPKRFLEDSALWRAAGEKEGEGTAFLRPDFTDKSLWGKPPRGSSAGFPRKPSVDSGSLRGLSQEAGPGMIWLGSTTDPSGAEGSVVHPFLGFDPKNFETWLDPSGWVDSDDVTGTTANAAADLAELQQKWDDASSSNPLQKGRYWYCAEVTDKTALILILRGLSARIDDDRQRLIDDLVQKIGLLERVELIAYDFFYPGHQDLLIPKDSPQGTPPNEILTYGGDWTSVMVLVSRRPAAGSPWEGQMVGATRHKFSAFELSSKLRHTPELLAWDDAGLAKLGATHPVLFVSQGSHSNYFGPGDHEALSPSLPDAVKDKLNEKIQGVVDKAQDKLDDAETTKDEIVVAVKALAGLAAGGPLGAVVGLVAGVIEALTTSAPDVNQAVQDKLDSDANKGTEPGPAATPTGSMTPGIGLAILPPGVSLSGALTGDLATQLASQNATLSAKQMEVWQSSQLTDPSTGIFKDPDADGREYFQVIDRSRPAADPAHLQVWFPASGNVKDAVPGFEGRWGVRVTDDKFGRKAGMQWVDYSGSLLAELIAPQEDDPSLSP